ncbi:hypothetical protein [Spiroplasma sp. SV19]|uniref:hypothetical protein n=1 Tax=Spiroplasma sp. SV19 TaxID=2570468 RepID=UPI0024B7967C|nr:hypothetical protein [Spiroplasma sp. SV19]WHQ37194.1 hypothetical protein E7Y35_04805 [Spiroplasma sp. SV19]
MERNKFYSLMDELITNKHNELLPKKTGRFAKAWDFEGNAVGQIGEEFVKRIFQDNDALVEENNKTIHNEFDILYQGNKIEIKTAKIGRNKSSNGTFQFNGINPKYNYAMIILIGIESDVVKYRIIPKKDINYIHNDRQYKVKYNVNGVEKTKALVSMNPGNEVNKKLTLSSKELYDDIENLFININNLLK